MKLLSIGDVSVDDYVELGRRFPGGNAVNVAIYANRIPDVKATYIGVVGNDEAGDFLLDQIRREGLETKYIRRLPGVSPVTTIQVRNGDRVFSSYDDGVQEHAKFPDELIPGLKNYDLIHFTIWGFGRELIARLSGPNAPLLSCDFSNKLDDPATDVMPWLDFSFFSGRHLEDSNEDPADKLRALKSRTRGLAVMTLGEKGSLVDDGQNLHRGYSRNVKVVDTLGAGDAYIAAFLCARYMGATIDDSILAGHRAASEVCKRLGAWGGNKHLAQSS